ncbi:MAG: hypothetical protein ABSD90_18360 [Methylocystis sp.]
MHRRSFASEPAARLFLALSQVGGGALFLLASFTLGFGFGLGFGAAAILFLATTGVDQRAGAGFALCLGEGAQHCAGAAFRRRRLRARRFRFCRGRSEPGRHRRHRRRRRRRRCRRGDAFLRPGETAARVLLGLALRFGFLSKA